MKIAIFVCPGYSGFYLRYRDGVYDKITDVPFAIDYMTGKGTSCSQDWAAHVTRTNMCYAHGMSKLLFKIDPADYIYGGDIENGVETPFTETPPYPVEKAPETPQSRYDAKNTEQIHLKLNLKTDADILEWLIKQPSKQGYIKSLIRADISASKTE